MSEQVASVCRSRISDEAIEQGAQLVADLAAFVKGRLIPVMLDSTKNNQAVRMKRLKPPPTEIWTLRSVFDPPGLRVFGRFAGKDNFVALACEDRVGLGPIRSRQWRYWMERCEAEWQKRLPTHNPFSGDTVHDYLSNAYEL